MQISVSTEGFSKEGMKIEANYNHKKQKNVKEGD